MAVLGAPQSPAPVTTTVINIRSDTTVPDHIVWSLFNTIFMYWCCLGFVAFAYSVKVGGHLGRLQKVLGAWRGPSPMARALGSPWRHPSPDGACTGEPPCVRVCVHALWVCVCVCVCVCVWLGGSFPVRLMVSLPGFTCGGAGGLCLSHAKTASFPASSGKAQPSHSASETRVWSGNKEGAARTLTPGG